jgi:hypothetical protein
MIDLLYALLATARSSVKSQRELALENLALRPARSNTHALAFARAEIVSDQIVTRAQGK